MQGSQLCLAPAGTVFVSAVRMAYVYVFPMVGVALPVATWVSPGLTGCETVVGSCREQGPDVGVCSSSYRVDWT